MTAAQVINMFNIVELALVLQPFYFSTSGLNADPLHSSEVGLLQELFVQVPDVVARRVSWDALP